MCIAELAHGVFADIDAEKRNFAPEAHLHRFEQSAASHGGVEHRASERCRQDVGERLGGPYWGVVVVDPDSIALHDY
ncbi:hypothetical protein ASD23_12865 [Agromyces sp. Root1464]|nr:hypothetical protein ASD23_12865 [Agromyces sp. Root1464]